MINRRKFLTALGAGSALAAAPFVAKAATTKRVVVIGGGMTGAAVAKYLRLWSGKTIAVTLVTPSTTYVSNIMSNLVVTGQVAYSSLQFTYAKLAQNYGVQVVTGTVLPGGISGSLATGFKVQVGATSYPCDRVVLAPGIEMDAVPLTSNLSASAPVLHAWQAGPQTQSLQTLLTGMPVGGTVVMTIPKAPYRCPPGPYERACILADYLLRNKGSAKLIVLDANPDILVEKENFGTAFLNYKWNGVLEYWPGASVVSANQGGASPGKQQTIAANVQELGYYPQSMSDAWKPGPGSFYGDVVNIIPSHKAPAVVSSLGLVDSSRFAPVDVRSFESMVSGKQGIHIIGDASSTSLPKAGHVGNQEAKICASAIVSFFNGQIVEQLQLPTANSSCFSPINNTQASWLTAIYQYNNNASVPLNKRMVVYDDVSFRLDPTAPMAATEANYPSTTNFSQMNKWYQVLMSDTFA